MIETPRLSILPLDVENLQKHVTRPGLLQQEMGLQGHEPPIGEELREALDVAVFPNVQDTTKNYLFFTLWLMIDRQHRCIVGSLLFKGEPDEQGEIEIGYGMYPEFENRGYMTEAVGAMLAWAGSQQQVKGILAETEKNNMASGKVLEKNGFRQYAETDDLLKWRYEV